MSWFDILSYMLVGTSTSISAVQIGRWFLTANPLAVAIVTRWSKVALLGLTSVALIWLVTTHQWMLAMLVAAFTLPVFVQSGLHWLTWLGAPKASGPSPTWWDSSTGHQDFPPPVVSRGFIRRRVVNPAPIDPDLARQSVAVLKAYLARTAPRPDYRHSSLEFVDDAREEPPTERRRGEISTAEARAILGIGPAADPHQVGEAHRRLRQKLASELHDTHYLTLKVDQARDALLEECNALVKSE